MEELEKILKTNTELPLSKKTILNILITNTVFKEEIQSVLKPFDLSLEQFNVLRILRGQKGSPLNLQDIQDRMVSKMSNTTRLVDKLILKEYVERFTCEKNRRKVEIFITKKGLKALKELDTIIDDSENLLTSNLSKAELEQLNQLLNKLRTQT
ncbi:MAG: MarR family transcriptional regulator [Gelidibacter sp.]